MSDHLTDTLADVYPALVPYVSPAALATLVRHCAQSTEEPEKHGLLCLFRGDLLDAYDWSRQCAELPRKPLLQLFLHLGSATEAADELGMSARTARSWVEDFCRFVKRVCEHLAKQDRDAQAREAQCEESCGRKRQHGPAFGTGAWTASERTRKEPRFDLGGQCAGCPVRAG